MLKLGCEFGVGNVYKESSLPAFCTATSHVCCSGTGERMRNTVFACAHGGCCVLYTCSDANFSECERALWMFLRCT